MAGPGRAASARLPGRLLALVVALVVAGCGPTERRAADDRFTLAVVVPRVEWSPDEAIDIRGSLAFHGPERRIDVGGSGSGLVTWSLEQLDGPLDPGGGGTDDCRPHEIARDRPMDMVFTKSGGFGAGGPGTAAAAIRAYFEDPVLRLPAGTYRITAWAQFAEGRCDGPRHDLAAWIDLRVGGGSGRGLEPQGPFQTHQAPPPR